MTRTYRYLSRLHTFEERFEYLKLEGSIGQETFGFDRYLNQSFYQSYEWKHFRQGIIIRDNGCDLGIEDYPINGVILIHHINPITMEDLINKRTDILLDPGNVICVSKATHNAIHYGMDNTIPVNKIVDRKPNDTCPWKV